MHLLQRNKKTQQVPKKKFLKIATKCCMAKSDDRNRTERTREEDNASTRQVFITGWGPVSSMQILSIRLTIIPRGVSTRGGHNFAAENRVANWEKRA